MNAHFNTFNIKVSFGLPLFILLIAVLVSACTDENQTVVNFSSLVMYDEFDADGAPNDELWTAEIGTGPNGDGWGNQELQFYSDRTENVTINNGILVITARQEDFNGSSYTSARLATRGKFDRAYGRFEARIRVPYGQGMWPAFWLLGANEDPQNGLIWPQIGEIDIMEIRGQEPSTTLGSVHGPGYSAGESISKSYNIPNNRFDTGFHVFGIEWDEDYINYYVDDVLYNQITRADVEEEGEWVFDHPFYIIINLAVGGTFVGSPDSETVFPQSMLVDYVRVYRR